MWANKGTVFRKFSASTRFFLSVVGELSGNGPDPPHES
jgi:hypothetical protein